MDELIDVEDLVGYPGAPFSTSQVAAAAGQIRDTCGWHIAPEITETITVDSDGSTVLALPTLKVGEITAIRDVTQTTATVLDPTTWRASPAGLLVRPAGWPCGIAALEVDLMHGYETCPDALLPVIAERCQLFNRDGSIRQESLGSRSATFGLAERSPSVATLARYTVPTLP